MQLQHVGASIAIEIHEEKAGDLAIDGISLVEFLEADGVGAAAKENGDIEAVAIDDDEVAALIVVEIGESDFAGASPDGHFSREDEGASHVTVGLYFVGVANDGDDIVPTVVIKIREFSVARFSVHVEALDESHIEGRLSGETSPRFEQSSPLHHSHQVHLASVRGSEDCPDLERIDGVGRGV